MKKLFFTLVALVLTSTLASAQQINLWKNGKCINQIPTANVDSITFSDKAPVKPTTNITIDDIVDTWRIYYSTGHRMEGTTITESWNKDVEADLNCFVFTPDKVITFMEYSEDIEGQWNEDGMYPFTIANGKVESKSDDFEGQILSLEGNKMVIDYKFVDENRAKCYVDSIVRISKRTDVLRTETNKNPARPDALQPVTMNDIVGTWLISHAKGYETENETEIDRWDGNVENEKNYYVFFPDKRFGFLEYSDESNEWHLDGYEYYPFDIKNDRFVAPYTELLEFDGETAKVYTCFTEEKGSTEEKECNIFILRRVSNRTDYIKYRELNE